LIERTPVATAAFKDAPVDATVLVAKAEGGVGPWSIDDTKIALKSTPSF
jgi:hypothetical protein